jgi:hypothetical protein
MATLRGEPVDRPAVNFYEVGGFLVDPADPDPFNIYNSPSWQPLLQLAEETDIIRMCSPLRPRSHEPGQSKTVAKHPRDEFFEVHEYIENKSRYTRTSLTIAGRKMTSLTRRDQDMDTVWTLEHLLKDVDDLKAYLELPGEVFEEEVNVGSLIKEDEKIGDRGIVMVDTEDPICAAATLFDMADFTIAAMTERKLFHRLLEKFARNIQLRTEKVAQDFPGHLWRIYGPEFATEPYLPPKLFEEYVVRYTGPMVRAIERCDGFARIHSHGRVKAVLDYVVQMGASAIDPLEPPPQGDVELAEVRRKYGDKLVLFGNIEISDIENMPPRQFEQVVKKTLKDGTSGSGRGFVLLPSACPCGREITPTALTNYETMVRLTEDFGS